jgi:hypothetical protein
MCSVQLLNVQARDFGYGFPIQVDNCEYTLHVATIRLSKLDNKCYGNDSALRVGKQLRCRETL